MATQVARKEFGTVAQLKAAQSAIAKARTKEDVVTAFKAHLGSCGHKRLSKLLLGADPASIEFGNGQ